MSRPDFTAELAAFRKAHPEITHVEVFMVDLNSRPRGKAVPVDQLDKLAAGEMTLPSSTAALDQFAEDVYAAGLAIQTGDPDGAVTPVPGTLAPILWADPPMGQVQVTTALPDGTPAPHDPRVILSDIVDRATGLGLTPVMALEQEFYLVDAHKPLPPIHPVTGERLDAGQVYDLDVARAFAPILHDIDRAAKALGAPCETMLSEFGRGQFEMNLAHGPDPLAAADQCMALRRAVRGVARAHGLDASFMPKPWGDTVGSGLHLHLSLLKDGVPLFDGADGSVSGPLGHAVAGCVRHMADAMLIFAPHLNSYRRFSPGFLAPCEATWGGDHRGVAVRLPETRGPSARLEHRVAGSDANPYLVTAAVLAAVLAGLEAGEAPPPPLEGEALPGKGAPLPLTWEAATEVFATSPFIRDWLGAHVQHVLTEMKRQEQATLKARVTDVEYAVYLR